MSSDVLDRSLNNNKNKIATIYFHIVTLNIGYSLMTIQPAVLFIDIFFSSFHIFFNESATNAVVFG